MVLNDVVKYYKEVNEIISELDEFVARVENIRSFYNNWSVDTFVFINVDRVNSSNYDYLNKSLADFRDKLYKNLQALDPFKLGEVVTNLSNYLKDNEEFSCIGVDFKESYKQYYNSIFSFINLYDKGKMKSEFSKLVRSLDSIVSEYKDLKNTVKLLTSIEKLLINDLKDEKYEIISLKFYGQYTSISEFSETILALEKCYNLLCAIANIDMSGNKLIPLKIESGSLYELIAGNPIIIGILPVIFEQTFIFVGKKIADKINEGKDKKENSVTIYNELNNQLDLVARFKELGIEVDTSIMEDTFTQLSMNLYETVVNNSKIEINGKSFTHEEQIQQQLSSKKLKYLKDINIDK